VPSVSIRQLALDVRLDLQRAPAGLPNAEDHWLAACVARDAGQRYTTGRKPKSSGVLIVIFVMLAVFLSDRSGGCSFLLDLSVDPFLPGAVGVRSERVLSAP
jgi:hypothetical protein